MDPDSLLIAVLLGVALAALGFFAVAESALGGLSRARYQHLLEEGSGQMKAIADFVERPNRYATALRAASALSTMAIAVLATALALHLSLADHWWLLGGVVVAALALFVGHALPRAIVVGHPEEVARSLVLPVKAVAVLLAPVASAVDGMTGLVARLLGRPVVPEGPIRSPEELREIIGERLVEEDEREMIDGIFELEETTAREIMVPRLDVVALPASTPVADAIDVIVKEGYSRLPIYEDSIDDVVGILYAKDLLPLVRSGQLGGQVRDLARPAYFIPESKKIDELLRELQQKKVHIAVVVDEYGGTAGLVTIEDLLEEIVGEIRDEFDLEEDKIVEGKEGEAIFDATVSIDDVNDTLDLHLEGEEVDTIGGLVYERLGKVPLAGDQIDADGATVTVVSTTGRRIKKVKVTRVASTPNGSSPPGA